jgi:hypothetical protein
MECASEIDDEALGFWPLTFMPFDHAVILFPQDGNLFWVDTNALEGCTNLRNMALPPTTRASHLTFSNRHDMIQRTNNVDILEALQNRFERLVVHDMCYHCGKVPTIDRLEDAVAADSEKERFLHRDKLVLNLLQGLLLSFNSNREILLFLISRSILLS